MNNWLADLGLSDILTPTLMKDMVKALVVVFLGLVVARLAAAAVRRMTATRLEPAQGLLVRRMVFYTVLSLTAVSALHQLGIELGLLVGAAGILTVALGFASQTSASNLISGLFLLAERPFQVGDVIQIEDTVGEVLSVDLLSVKLRTYDNRLVRLPNESIIQTRLTNLTAFPIRRVDVMLGVAYKEDIDRVERILFEVADADPLCLDEPKPRFFFLGYGDSSLDLQFSVWATRDNFFQLKTRIQVAIKRAFDREDIEIPFPHRTLYTGSVTEPFPVRLVTPAPSDRDD
jgi:small-conductance mechanosensitive channel